MRRLPNPRLGRAGFQVLPDRERCGARSQTVERRRKKRVRKNAPRRPGRLSTRLGSLIALPRGPKGPLEAPAGVLLMQLLMHSQHHRDQNASRMRALGVEPPMTDFVIWYAAERAGS
ncbi:MAG: DinB family protein [Bryobacteraceae bacterium]